jgi:hypothetical protein
MIYDGEPQIYIALEIASEMLTGFKDCESDIHDGLHQAIRSAATYTRIMGGTLKSRQAIATIIALWISQNPKERPIKL